MSGRACLLSAMVALTACASDVDDGAADLASGVTGFSAADGFEMSTWAASLASHLDRLAGELRQAGGGPQHGLERAAMGLRAGRAVTFRVPDLRRVYGLPLVATRAFVPDRQQAIVMTWLENLAADLERAVGGVRAREQPIATVGELRNLVALLTGQYGDEILRAALKPWIDFLTALETRSPVQALADQRPLERLRRRPQTLVRELELPEWTLRQPLDPAQLAQWDATRVQIDRWSAGVWRRSEVAAAAALATVSPLPSDYRGGSYPVEAGRIWERVQRDLRAELTPAVLAFWWNADGLPGQLGAQIGTLPLWSQMLSEFLRTSMNGAAF